MSDAKTGGTTTTIAPPAARRLRDIGRSLAHRNFRLFFGGQSVSLLGTSMLQAFLLWGLTISGLIAVWQLIFLSLFLGCVNAFDMPTRQAFMTEMLDTSEDLANAIAINSSMVNGARLIGPSIAGLVISIVGEATCFLLNGLSFLGVIAALLAMKIRRREHEEAHKSVLHGLTEGFRYAFGFPPVRALLLLVALIGLVGMPYAVLMPIFADQVLHGDARTYGLLVGSSGVGALAGSLYLASRSTVLGLGRWIAAMSGVFGIGLIAFSFSTSLALSMAFLVVMGFAVIVQLAASNTILQTIVEDGQRGRVMSLYTTAFLGMSPLGSLVAGSLASAIGAPRTLQIGGIIVLFGGIGFAIQLRSLRKHIRPIYTRMGILPAVASGLQQATEQTVPPEET